MSNNLFTDFIIEKKILVKTFVLHFSIQLINECRIASPIKVAYEL